MTSEAINISVQRSPAKVCWWVVVNGIIFGTFDKRYEASEEAIKLMRKYG